MLEKIIRNYPIRHHQIVLAQDLVSVKSFLHMKRKMEEMLFMLPKLRLTHAKNVGKSVMVICIKIRFTLSEYLFFLLKFWSGHKKVLVCLVITYKA